MNKKNTFEKKDALQIISNICEGLEAIPVNGMKNMSIMIGSITALKELAAWIESHKEE